MVKKMHSDSTAEQAAKDLASILYDESPHQGAGQIAERHQQSDRYCRDFEMTGQLLADLEPLSDNDQILAVVDKYNAGKTKQRNFINIWKLSIAAVLMVAVSFTFLMIYNAMPPSEQDTLRYVTRVGEQKTVTLKDGSVIDLNTTTQVLVTFSDTRRMVTLERGEAYFKVTPDRDRPFTVNVGSRSVTVVGTEFNLFKTPQKVVLAVLEGAVTLHDQGYDINPMASRLQATGEEPLPIFDGGQYRINAGMVAEIDQGSRQLSAYAPEKIADIQSWRTGVIRFDEVPLSQVIQELNRYSAKKILIEDATVMDMRVYATVRVGSPSMALTALERLLPIEVIQHFDRVVIVRKNNGLGG